MMSKRRKGNSDAKRQRTAPSGSWPVRYHPKARVEADALPVQEQKAIDRAVNKLASLGPTLTFPHSSKVMAILVARYVNCARAPGAARGGASMNAWATCS